MNARWTRRTVLVMAGAGVTGLAGCLGDNDEGQVAVEEDTAWRREPLEDATTGAEFVIGDFDSPVVLHTFATWCTTCRSQQQDMVPLYESRGDDIEMVDLTVDENDDPDDVAAHAETHGFGWRFSVSPSDVTRSLVEDFGERVAVAPQAPVIVVCPDGAAVTLDKGVSVDEIESAIDDCS